MKKKNSFTFIEIMVVVIILGVLGAIVLPKFTGRTQDAKKEAARTQIQTLSTTLDTYELDVGRFPSSEQGLDALTKKPSGHPAAKGWKGPYLSKKSVPNDPWGSKYLYKSPGTKNPRSYDLSSYGPDGKEGGGDDLTSW